MPAKDKFYVTFCQGINRLLATAGGLWRGVLKMELPLRRNTGARSPEGRIDLRVRRWAWQELPSAGDNFRKICHRRLLVKWALDGSGMSISRAR